MAMISALRQLEDHLDHLRVLAPELKQYRRVARQVSGSLDPQGRATTKQKRAPGSGWSNLRKQ
jgi:hypothetical protein